MITARSLVISWPGQRQYEARTAESSADMPCGRIDTRFRRRRFLHRDTSLSSTRFPWVHRTDKVCVRTFWFLDSPLRIHPFQLHPTSRTIPTSMTHDVAPPTVPTRRRVKGKSLTPGNPVLTATSSPLIACSSPNIPLH